MFLGVLIRRLMNTMKAKFYDYAVSELHTVENAELYASLNKYIDCKD